MNMKNPIQKTLMQGIKDLHIKILQSNNLPEIGNYLQEILDKVIPAIPENTKKVKTPDNGLSKSRIIQIMKSDINSILEGTNQRAELAKYKASLHIAWLKKFFTESKISSQ